jgi:hypothetical protein
MQRVNSERVGFLSAQSGMQQQSKRREEQGVRIVASFEMVVVAVG